MAPSYPRVSVLAAAAPHLKIEKVPDRIPLHRIIPPGTEAAQPRSYRQALIHHLPDMIINLEQDYDPDPFESPPYPPAGTTLPEPTLPPVNYEPYVTIPISESDHPSHSSSAAPDSSDSSCTDDSMNPTFPTSPSTPDFGPIRRHRRPRRTRVIDSDESIGTMEKRLNISYDIFHPELADHPIVQSPNMLISLPSEQPTLTDSPHPWLTSPQTPVSNEPNHLTNPLLESPISNDPPPVRLPATVPNVSGNSRFQ